MSAPLRVIDVTKSATPVDVPADVKNALATQAKTNALQLDIEHLLQRKGANGEKVGEAQFARLASEFLLQEYELAKAESTLKFGSSIGLFLNNITSTFGKALIPIGLLSAFAVDFAIFGGAHTALMVTNKWFLGLAVGSLLTATLIGTAENKYARGAYILTAVGLSAAAAYLAASSNPEFKGLWASQFSHMDVDYNAAAAKLAVADADKALLSTQVADLEVQVRTGGVGGKHVATDGNPHNDYLIRDLAAAKAKLATATSQAAEFGTAARDLAPRRPSQTYGLYGGALYLGAWLTLAQMQVANIISKGPKWLADSKNDAKHIAAQRELVRALEDNPHRVEAKTSAILERMKEVYVAGLTAKMGAEEAKRFVDGIFTDKTEEKMVKDSAKLFADSLKRRAPAARGQIPAHLKLEAA